MNLFREGAIQVIQEIEPGARSFFDNIEPRWRTEKDFGVTGSTFRAYRGFSQPPSSVYGRWAASWVGPLAGELEKILTREDFQALHGRLADSLETFWEKEQGRTLKFRCFSAFSRASRMSIARSTLGRQTKIPGHSLSLAPRRP